MRVKQVTCTQTMSIKAIVQPKCRPTTSIRTICQTVIRTRCPMALSITPRPPTEPIIMCRKNPSQSWPFPLLPSRTTSWSWVTLRAVSFTLAIPRSTAPCLLVFLFPLFSLFPLLLSSSILISITSTSFRLTALVYTAQSGGGWLIWNRMVMRLAWDATAQYTHVGHAVWSWSQARICREKACCC